MKVHVIQHVSFEGLSSIEAYIKKKDHTVTYTHLYNDEKLPPIQTFDWLIIMGGPMGIYDESKHPWLAAEKQFIKAAITSGKTILGICLGAQLIADTMGAKVYKNPHREIGWFDITQTATCQSTILASAIPERTTAFHWHGDTFDIPQGAQSLAQSQACQNQGFIYDNRVTGLQFHLEITSESTATLIDQCRDELDGSMYVQTEEFMLSKPQSFTKINLIMFDILEAMEDQYIKSNN